jgi:hypothetical protein
MKPELPHVVAASEHRYEGEKKAWVKPQIRTKDLWADEW